MTATNIVTFSSFISILDGSCAENFKLCLIPYKNSLDVHATMGYKKISLLELLSGVTASTKGPELRLRVAGRQEVWGAYGLDPLCM